MPARTNGQRPVARRRSTHTTPPSSHSGRRTSATSVATRDHRPPERQARRRAHTRAYASKCELPSRRRHAQPPRRAAARIRGHANAQPPKSADNQNARRSRCTAAAAYFAANAHAVNQRRRWRQRRRREQRTSTARRSLTASSTCSPSFVELERKASRVLSHNKLLSA